MLLTVCDLFDAQATEAASQRLVAVLNAQAKQIERLDALVQTLVAGRDAQQRHSATQQQQLAQLQTRLTTLESAVSQQNEHVGSMETSLEAMQESMDRKVDRSMLEHAVQKLTQQNSSLARQMRLESINAEMTRSLHEDQSLLHERLAVIDRRLETKLEKSAVSRLEVVAAQIHAFAPARQQIEGRLDQLESMQGSHSDEIGRNDTRWRDLDQRVDSGAAQIKVLRSQANQTQKTLLEQAVPQLSTHDQQIRLLGSRFNQLKGRAESGEATQLALSTNVTSVATAFNDEMKKQHQYFQNLIQTKASKQEMQAQYNTIQQRLQDAVRQNDFQTLLTRFEKMLPRWKAIEQHVDLSTRFVAWFASRGDAYEHNLSLVDKQLQRLAQITTDPQTREPFDSHIRFPLN